MKTILAITLACACMHANAESALGGQARGGHRGGPAIGGHANSQAASQNGSNAGRYTMFPEDNYQPWPQEEMKQFAKPEWHPYNGE